MNVFFFWLLGNQTIDRTLCPQIVESNNNNSTKLELCLQFSHNVSFRSFLHDPSYILVHSRNLNFRSLHLKQNKVLDNGFRTFYALFTYSKYLSVLCIHVERVCLCMLLLSTEVRGPFPHWLLGEKSLRHLQKKNFLSLERVIFICMGLLLWFSKVPFPLVQP